MADIKDVLKRLLSELEKEERDELLDSLKGRKLTGEELVESIKNLPPESRKEVREALAEVKEDIEEEEEDKSKPKKKTDDKKSEEEEEDNSSKSKRKTRPGRKSGRAYDWWIDDDGQVVRLDIARVYSGEDEPDEVEMFPVAEEKEEEEEEEETA